MLSKVLKRSTCANCKFCCSFRKTSLWETPLFPQETMDKLEKDHMARNGEKLTFHKQVHNGETYGQMNLLGYYQTENPDEEAPCEFLDAQKGCMLSDEDKPFDCKIWPLRIMEKENKLVIALTPTCPSINEQPLERMEKLVNEEGLGDQIYEYAKTHQYMIKDYKEGFPILKEYQKL